MGIANASKKNDLTKKPPLNLPFGSVRAILAIIVVAGAVIGCLLSGNYEMLNNFAMMALSLYFVTRHNNSKLTK